MTRKKALKLPDLETITAYAVEKFEGEYDRRPSPEELNEIEGEARSEFRSMMEAYAEWMEMP